jgi:Plasma-membrane choline transporter
MKTLLCCLKCIINQIESLMKYLVRNAYIIVAKDGKPLMLAGKKAFHLLKKNLIDVIALNQLGDFLLLGKIFIVLITGLVGYAVMGVRIFHFFALCVL